MRDVDPGYIKGYLPGVRENGGQYTHAAIWSVLAFAALGDGDKAGELFSILNPINHASTPRRRPALQGRALRHGRRRLRRAAAHRPRRLDLVHGLRRLDVPGRARVASSASASAATTLRIDPCIPRAWPGYEIDFRYHSARYEIVVENPHGVSRGVVAWEVDGQPGTDGAAIPLADDGATHRVRVVLG